MDSSDPINALNQMYRVLAPGGVVWLSDMRHDASDRKINAFENDTMKLTGFNGFTTKMIHRHTLRKRACTRVRILELVSRTPLKVLSFEERAMEFYLMMQK